LKLFAKISYKAARFGGVDADPGWTISNPDGYEVKFHLGNPLILGFAQDQPTQADDTDDQHRAQGETSFLKSALPQFNGPPELKVTFKTLRLRIKRFRISPALQIRYFLRV
jgi:hypothetical protein